MVQEFAVLIKMDQEFAVLLKMIQEFVVLLKMVQEFAVKCNSPRAGGVTAGIRKNLGFVQNSWKDCTLHSPSNKIQLKIALLSEDE